MGVDVLRISPQHNHTMEIIELFEAARKGGSLEPLSRKLQGFLPLGACNGYLAEQAGMQFSSEAIHETLQAS